jgi:hypothetical protein
MVSQFRSYVNFDPANSVSYHAKRIIIPFMIFDSAILAATGWGCLCWREAQDLLQPAMKQVRFRNQLTLRKNCVMRGPELHVRWPAAPCRIL